MFIHKCEHCGYDRFVLFESENEKGKLLVKCTSCYQLHEVYTKDEETYLIKYTYKQPLTK